MPYGVYANSLSAVTTGVDTGNPTWLLNFASAKLAAFFASTRIVLALANRVFVANTSDLDTIPTSYCKLAFFKCSS